MCRPAIGRRCRSAGGVTSWCAPKIGPPRPAASQKLTIASFSPAPQSLPPAEGGAHRGRPGGAASEKLLISGRERRKFSASDFPCEFVLLRKLPALAKAGVRQPPGARLPTASSVRPVEGPRDCFDSRLDRHPGAELQKSRTSRFTDMSDACPLPCPPAATFICRSNRKL